MYVISLVDSKHLQPGYQNKKIWYVHMKGFSNIPVSGSFGSRNHALNYLAMYSLMTISDLRNYRKKHHLPIEE